MFRSRYLLIAGCIALIAVLGQPLAGAQDDGPTVIQLTQDEGTNYHPHWSPDGTQLCFISNRDGDFDLYMMDADGSHVVQLTDDDRYDYSCVWSPDGTRIAFSAKPDDDWEIFIIDLEDNTETQITDNDASDSARAWSQDGAQLFFASDRDGDWEMYMMDTDGSHVVQLTDGFEIKFFCWTRWLPENEKTVCYSDPDHDGEEEIYMTDADGSNVIQLTDNDVPDFEPDLSPDGDRIVFGSGFPGVSRLYLMDSDGNNVEQLTQLTGFQAQWSPDGTRIAIVSDPGETFDIYIIELE